MRKRFNILYEPFNITAYYYADVFVQDSNGIPISDARVSILDNQSNNISILDRTLNKKNTFTTKSDGHINMPNDGNSNTAVIADFYRNSTTRTYFSYNLFAYDPNNIWTNVTHTIYPNGTIQQLQPLANVSNVNPDASWYRSDPNTYQNTTTLHINYTKTNITIAVTNITNITVSEYTYAKINFTATNSTASQKMNITISNSTFPVINGLQYRIKKDGVVQSTQAASSNQVQFTDINVGSEYIIESFNNLTVALNAPQNTLLTNNATQLFNCSVSSGSTLSNLTLYANSSGVFTSNGTANISGTSNSSAFTRTLTDGSYIWNCLAYDNTGNSSFATSNYTLTIDTTPPMSITSLSNQSQSDTWIYWNWTNPADFNNTEIWLNGTNVANTSNNFYNATELNASTWYQISIRTVDLAGNINQTWVNSTAKTVSDTTPPVITIIGPINTSALSADTTSTWINITTDENATCRYNLTNSSFAYSDGTNFTNTGGVNHSLFYSGLSNSNTYALYYLCNDTSGNINAQPVYHTFSVSAAQVETPSGCSGCGGGGSSGGGSITTQNKTNQTSSNATVTLPPIINTTNSTTAPQEPEIKQKAQEKINEVNQKITPEDITAKQKLSEAESAYSSGQYDKAYSLAVEAEGLIGNGIITEGTEPEKKPYLVYAITALVLVAAGYALRKGYVKMNPKKIAVTEEPKEISGESVDRQGTSSSGDVEMDDMQKRLEEIRRKLRE